MGHRDSMTTAGNPQFLILLVLIATTWNKVQGVVKYDITIAIASEPDSGTNDTLYVDLSGTEGAIPTTSLGNTSWEPGKTPTRSITSPFSIGYLKEIAVSKSSSLNVATDDSVKILTFTVGSTALTKPVVFACRLPYCHLQFPNLVARIFAPVDGGWSNYIYKCDCANHNDSIGTRTCTNPPVHFGGKQCVGKSTTIVSGGCRGVCDPSSLITTPEVTTTATITTAPPIEPTTTEITIETTESPLIVYGIPILAALVTVALVIVIVMCIYGFCFAKKEKRDKSNQVSPNYSSRPGTATSLSGRPIVPVPLKHNSEEKGVPKQYILPIFGNKAEKRELFGEDSGDSQTSLLRVDTSTPPLATSLPSVQGQEENFYSEVAAPKVEKTVAGLPTIVGATKYTTARTSAPGSPQRQIHRMTTPHTISLPGNTIIRAGSVIESEDIHEVT